jgi:GNAT superfamily N-acetyltransferase
MNIDVFDVHTASEDDLRKRYEFGCRLDEELDPETPHAPYDAWRRQITTTSKFRDVLRWVARDGDEHIGHGYLGLGRTDDNRHLCHADIWVAPEQRRQGIGADLLRVILDAAEADGRSVVGGGTVQGHDAEQFLKTAGFEQKLLDRRSRLHIDRIPEGLLDQWLADAEKKATGYSLIEIAKKVQPEYRERFLDVLGAMNDAPREGLDREDEHYSLEQLDDWERQSEENGTEDSFLVVMHDETGEFAGYTGIEWDPAQPTVLWQGGTAVKAAHRGHAIGRWLKAANIRAVQARNPEARFIDTWNAGSNKWMLAINDDLGFAPYIWYTAWQAPIADAKAALAAK